MRGVTRRAWMATALASLAGCSALDVLNAVSTSDASVPALGLPYGAHPRQRLDVYRPVRPMEGPPRAVVFFYGGSWREGDRKDYAFVGEALAAAGSIAMVADYRLYPEVRYPDFLLDCAAATAFARRWLDRQGYADARLFVAGHSAGAYNAAMLATDSRWLAMQGLRIETLSGWIGMAGPTTSCRFKRPTCGPCSTIRMKQRIASRCSTCARIGCPRRCCSPASTMHMWMSGEIRFHSPNA